MVNPTYNKIGGHLFVPDKFRTKLSLIYTAKESGATPGPPATANNAWSVSLNGLVFPLNATAAPPPGVRIDGTASTVATASPAGFLDIIGNSANAGLYQQYCVLNVSYKVTYYPLGLNDAQFVVIVPTRLGQSINSINEAEEYPYANRAKFTSGYSSTAQNTISGRINLAKFLGYESDLQYAADLSSKGSRTINPPQAPAQFAGTNGNGNHAILQVWRASANGTTLTNPLPYKVELVYDVEFTKNSADISE